MSPMNATDERSIIEVALPPSRRCWYRYDVNKVTRADAALKRPQPGQLHTVLA